MTINEVEKVRGTSRSGQYGPWKEWYDEMAKKTVIRRMSKKLPSSADVDAVMKADLEASGFDTDRKPVDVTPPEENKPLSRLKESIGLKETDAVEAANKLIQELTDGKETV